MRPMKPANEEGADFLQLLPSSAPSKGLTGWLVDETRTAIADGRLRTGARLPATRTLAADLGLSRGVVVEAYRRLADEGLISGRVGAGTLVTAVPAKPAATAPAAAEPAVQASKAVSVFRTPPRLPMLPGRPGPALDLSPGVPDLSAFPQAAWLRAERAVLGRASRADLAYGDPRGAPALRSELAGWLARVRGVRTEASDIVIVSGVAQSIALVAQTLTSAGSTEIAVEDPGSLGAQQALEYWGQRTVPVPVDAHGLQTSELARTGVQAAFLTPAHQFPTGVVLSPERRRELLSWAGRGGLVLEDDYDAEHRYDRAPVPALQASAPDQVVYTGSTSKTLAPGLRLGWLVAPRSMREDLVAAKHASDLGCPALPQLALAHLLAHGDIDRHTRLTRKRHRARRDALLTALREGVPQVCVQGVAAGLHLLITLPRLNGEITDTDLAERLAHAGVLTHPLSWHRRSPGPPGLVLGYAAHTPDRLREAARRISAVIGSVR